MKTKDQLKERIDELDLLLTMDVDLLSKHVKDGLMVGDVLNIANHLAMKVQRDTLKWVLRDEGTEI